MNHDATTQHEMLAIFCFSSNKCGIFVQPLLLSVFFSCKSDKFSNQMDVRNKEGFGRLTKADNSQLHWRNWDPTTLPSVFPPLW